MKLVFHGRLSYCYLSVLIFVWAGWFLSPCALAHAQVTQTSSACNARIREVTQKSGESDKVILYHAPFTAETPFAVTPENIASDNTKLIIQRQDDAVKIYEWLKDGCYGTRAVFNRGRVRLRIEAQGKEPLYIVDGNGIVKVKGRVYYMKPYPFLRLHLLLDRLATQAYEKSKPLKDTSLP